MQQLSKQLGYKPVTKQSNFTPNRYLQLEDLTVISSRWGPQPIRLQPHWKRPYQVPDVPNAFQALYNTSGKIMLSHMNGVKIYLPKFFSFIAWGLPNMVQPSVTKNGVTHKYTTSSTKPSLPPAQPTESKPTNNRHPTVPQPHCLDGWNHPQLTSQYQTSTVLNCPHHRIRSDWHKYRPTTSAGSNCHQPWSY